MSKNVIDAGRRKNTAGKRCLKSLDQNETREWALNDRVADALETYLLSAGHVTLRVDDMSGNTDVPLATRVKMANERKADYYASIHHNAGINGGTDGIKTADYYVLRKTIMPASLTECGLMDSNSDIKYILNLEWSRKIALGIAEGIYEVFGGTVKEEKKETEKVTFAKSFDENYAGTYISTTADLKLRVGANTKYDVLDLLPKGAKVRCYGYYTKESDGTV